MQVAISTSTVLVQTDEPDDTGLMTVSASQTDDVPISNETKKRVLLELGMSVELAEACLEFPEELCLRLQDFTDTHMPSSSYQRTGEAQMESDSDNDSEASTATTARREWELQEDEPQNGEEEEQNDENDEQNAEQNEERRAPMESMRMRLETLGHQLMRLRERLDQ